MILQNDSEVASTREKIGWVERRIETLQAQAGGSTRVRELTLWSLSRLLAQLKEDIARYESLHPSQV